jgi:hypothetical protein
VAGAETQLAATAYEPYSAQHGRAFFDSAAMVLRPGLAALQVRVS